MEDLLLEDVDPALVEKLTERAEENGRSVEEEHRQILADALTTTRRRTLEEALALIPPQK